MSILTNQEIQNRKSDLYLQDLSEKQFSQNSIDLSLGKWIFIDKSASLYPQAFEELKLGETVVGKNEKEYYKIDLEYFTDFAKGSSGHNFVLYPGMFILAHTNEFFGTKPKTDLCWQFLLKSTAARNGLDHCLAGFVESGYFSPLCLELYSHAPVEIRYGDLIGQAILHTTTDKSVDYTIKGSYQSTTNIDELRKNWKPEDILPGKIKNKYE